MTVSRPRLCTARIFVGDTCALVNEVFEGTRLGTLTSLLAALHHEAVRLYVPRHVIDEVGRHIVADAQARRRPVDPLVALQRWDALYAPHIRVVDVPDDWGRDDPRVLAVDGRHSIDTPSAQLAVTIAPSWVLTEDPDLLDNKLGVYNRLPMLFAAANDAEVGLVERAVAVPTVIGAAALNAAGRGLLRLPGWAQLVLATAAGVMLFHWYRDQRLVDGLLHARGLAVRFGRAVAPPLATIMARHQKGLAVWAEHEVTPKPNRSLPEQVAAVLSRAPLGGMLALEVARHIEPEVPLSRLVPAVRDVLSSCSAFTEVSRGRWMLGEPVTSRSSEISPYMVADWLRRSHQNDHVVSATDGHR